MVLKFWGVTQRDEEGDLLKAQWAEVAELDLVKVQKLAEEARSGEGESAFEVRREDDELTGQRHRPLLVARDPPLIRGLLWDDLRIDEGSEVLSLADGSAPAAVRRHVAGRRRGDRARSHGGGRR